jgi:hypothetical protein
VPVSGADWDSTDHPGQALAIAILLATQPKGLGKFWTDLNAPIRKLKGGGPAVQA